MKGVIKVGLPRFILVLVGLLFMLSSNASANVNNFIISKYDIQYELGRDLDGRSTLKTTETITAQFDTPNQNRGLERAIPEKYDGHETELDIISVKDEKGTDLQYRTYSQRGNTVVQIGHPDHYVHGQKTYIITYTQRGVTKFFGNTDSNEFYWDTNGTGWRVPINDFSVTLNVQADIMESYTSRTFCYFGSEGSTDTCDLYREGGRFTVRKDALSPGQNVSIVLGFEPGTFAEYKASLLKVLHEAWLNLLALSIPVGAAVYWIIIRKYRRKTYRLDDIGTIIPEYLPPKGVSVMAASTTVRNTRNVFTAQLIDLAVRRYIKIKEIRPKGLFAKAEYEIVVTRSIKKLLPEEQEILKDMFGKTPSAGNSLKLSKLRSSRAFASRMADNDIKLKKLIRGKYRLRHSDDTERAAFRKIGLVAIILAVVTLNPVALIILAISFVLYHNLCPLSDKGLALSKHLHGLRECIKVAEAERLKILQSPGGALKSDSADGKEDSKIINLYEQVLPYAILFGQEKEWAKQMGHYYESSATTPSWYSSSSSLSGVAFTSAMNNFNSSVASYPVSTNSFSGGSGGGGFSGGGGGGGGGGGW